MTINLEQWLQAARLKLQAGGLSNFHQEAEMLVLQLLNKPRAYLYTYPETCLTSAQLTQLEIWLQQRLAGQPLAYILGNWEFWGLQLAVSPATLIPRADTELLVEIALDLPLPKDAQVLDLGTGTGAVALALKSERSSWQVSAADVQPEAVALAKTNAQQLQLDVQVQQSNWWQQIPAQTWHLVVSNPPYIHPHDPHLQQGDLRYEPSSALVGGADGLAAYVEILAPIQQRLAVGGYLLVEHGYDQAAAVAELFVQAGLVGVTGFKDYGGQDRATLGQRV